MTAPPRAWPLTPHVRGQRAAEALSGELYASQRELAAAWGRSPQRVSTYLSHGIVSERVWHLRAVGLLKARALEVLALGFDDPNVVERLARVTAAVTGSASEQDEFARWVRDWTRGGGDASVEDVARVAALWRAAREGRN